MKTPVLSTEIKTNIKYGDTPTCVLCEFIMSQLERQIKDNATQDEIRDIVESVCTILPNTVSHDCQQFIDKYAKLIISLIATTPPNMICSEMMLCGRNIEKSKCKLNFKISFYGKIIKL